MLNLQAVFESKARKLSARECVIEKIVELPESEYRNFKEAPLRYMSFITENKGLMCQDANGVYHCLLAMGEGCSDGILIEAEGYDYAPVCEFPAGSAGICDRPFESTGRPNHQGGNTGNPGTAHGQSTLTRYRNGIMSPVTPNNGIGSMLLKNTGSTAGNGGNRADGGQL